MSDFNKFDALKNRMLLDIVLFKLHEIGREFLEKYYPMITLEFLFTPQTLHWICYCCFECFIPNRKRAYHY